MYERAELVVGPDHDAEEPAGGQVEGPGEAREVLHDAPRLEQLGRALVVQVVGLVRGRGGVPPAQEELGREQQPRGGEDGHEREEAAASRGGLRREELAQGGVERVHLVHGGLGPCSGLLQAAPLGRSGGVEERGHALLLGELPAQLGPLLEETLHLGVVGPEVAGEEAGEGLVLLGHVVSSSGDSSRPRRSCARRRRRAR